MAKAAPESALTFVALKVVLAELEARPLESPESARRLVAQVCDADRDRNYWTCREPADPPATFWRNPAQLTFSGSDVTNPAASLAEGDLDSLPGIGPAFMFGFVAVTLRGVSVAWEAIAALRPEIGPPPETAVLPAATPVAPAIVDASTAADFVSEDTLRLHPREKGETDIKYAERLLRDFAPKRWEVRTITNEFARLRQAKPKFKF